jgi:hypothetical protein
MLNATHHTNPPIHLRICTYIPPYYSSAALTLTACSMSSGSVSSRPLRNSWNTLTRDATSTSESPLNSCCRALHACVRRAVCVCVCVCMCVCVCCVVLCCVVLCCVCVCVMCVGVGVGVCVGVCVWIHGSDLPHHLAKCRQCPPSHAC